VITTNRRPVDSGQVVTATVAALFFVACTWTSYARWANFEYRTFDLAYYVQAIWQLIHGRLQVSVENVPLLGNHVEPIVFLFAPLFALFRHPMLFVVVQNAALAAMAPVGYNMAKRLGLDATRACLLGVALLVTPAAGYIALHEFHPEALTAPLLLLMFQARLANSVGRHWLWFLAVLACKENMALLLAAYCAVQCIVERKRGWAELRKWYLFPMGAAVLWFLLCGSVITPALNSDNIDYLALYDRLGSSPGDILKRAITQPQLIGGALRQSLTHGNLVWGLLFPFLFLPLLRLRWMVVSAPILLQHLLSWRSSEWLIYFHYAAPLLPVFWIALVEVVAAHKIWKSVSAFVVRGLPWLLIVACAIAQIWLGPAGGIAATTANWAAHRSDRARKNAFVSQIPSQASVVAPLPYLSHLAMREKLYSLHYILKGLKTLSRASYQPPPPTDFVLIDYLDSATFDPGAGYYHPTMKTADGRIIPSSDRLLHDFLKRSRWTVNSRDELTLLTQTTAANTSSTGGASSGEPTRVPGVAASGSGESTARRGARSAPEAPRRRPPSISSARSIVEMGTHTELISIDKTADVLGKEQPIEIRLSWRFKAERDVFPWMLLGFLREGKNVAVVTKGLCAPEADKGLYTERWHITSPRGLAAGDYSVEALFIDNSKRAWFEATGGGEAEATFLTPPVPLGRINVQ
jgi:uncharacterized membrane protein